MRKFVCSVPRVVLGIKKARLKIGLALLAAGAVFAPQGRAAIVINEVYPGGGSAAAGTTYMRDFVELFNTGATPVSLDGFKLQYASATGAFTNAVFSFGPGSIIGANDSLLIVTGNAGTAGATLTGTPTDGTNGTISGASLSATNGAVRLIDGSSTVVDLVGYGTAVNFEGTAAPSPAAGNQQSLARNDTTHADSGVNSADFTAGTPTPNPGTTSTAVAAPVPEPTSVCLLGLAAVLGVSRRRRRA
jgi:5'-nucleotidase